METRLVAYDRLGARRGVLPNPLEITFSKAYNEFTTMTLHYDRKSPKNAYLDNEPEIAVETFVNNAWVEIRDGRLRCLSVDFDHLEDVPTRTYEFIGVGEALKGVLVYNRYSLPLTDEGKVNFGNTNAGRVINTVWANAELRGWTGFTKTFTSTNDSAGQPWAKNFTISYDVTTSLLTIVNSFIAMGLIDMVWNGRELSLYNKGYLETNLSTGTNPVRFVGSTEVTAIDSAPEKIDQSSLATHVVIIGEGGLHWEFPTNAIVPEVRREVVQSYSGVDDVGTAEILAAPLILKAQNHLKNTTRQFHLTPKSKWLPFINYDVGNWVDTQRGTAIESLQIIAVNIQINQNGTQGYVTLGDKIDGLLETMYQRIQGLTGGVANEGGKPPVTSQRKPTAPTNLQVTTSTYIDETGKSLGRAQLSWQHDFKDIIGEAIDIKEYRSYYREVNTTRWIAGFTTSELSDTISPILVYREGDLGGSLMNYQFLVKAISNKGIASDNSAFVTSQMNPDTTPPPKPTTPKVAVWLRVPTISSDGKGLTPSDVVTNMPPDLDRMIVWTADNALMTNKTEVGRIKGATSINDIQRPADITRWYALQAYDYSGNMSEMSAAVSMTPTELVGEQSFQDALSSMNDDIGANTQAAADAAAKAQQGVDDALTAKNAADQAAQDAADADYAASQAAGAAQTAQDAANAAQKRADDLFAKGANLLQDAGFEGPATVYSNSIATVVSPSTASIKVVTDATKAHSGNSYLEMAFPASPATSTTAHLKPVPVSPDRTYRIGVWVYAEALDANKSVGLPFYWVNKDNALINNTWPALYYWADFGSKLVVGQWKYLIADIKPPAGAVLMGTRFYIDNQHTTTKLRVDDLTVTDITEALAAQTAATAAQADATQALADASSAMGVAIVGDAYSLNPSFEDWTSTYPNKFTKWGTGDPIKETTLVRLGNNAVRFTLDTTERGLNWTGILDHAPNMEYFTVELVFRLESGSLSGAGVLLDWIGLSPNRAQVNLVDEIPNPILGKWYKLVKVLRRPTTATGTWTGMDGYLMGNYTGNKTPTAKDLIFDWLNVRPATNEEITAYGAPALITAVDSKATAAQGDATKALADAKAAKDAADAAAAAASAAQSTADGKNTVSPSAPVAGDLTGKKANSLWTQVVGGKVIGSWYKATDTASAWTPLPFDPVMIPQIAIGAGTFGDLDGVRIKANSIGAKSLTVGDFTNLIDDGQFEATTFTPWTLYNDAVIQPDSGRANTNALRCTTPASRTTNIAAQQFKRPLKGGEKFYATMKVYRSLQVTTTSDVRMTVWYKKIDGTSNGSANVINLQTNSLGGWQSYVSSEITVPAGTEWLDIQLNVDPAYTGNVVWDDIWLVRKVGTVMIEKGAVTANEVNTNAFFADTGVIGKLNAQTGEFLTNADGTGMKSVVTGQGLKVTFTGDDGVEQDRIKVGTWDEDSISISNTAGSVVATMDNNGGVTGKEVYAENNFYYKGRELTEVLDERGRGIVAWASRGTGSLYWAGTAAQPYLHLRFQAEAGRSYQIHTTPINIDSEAVSADPIIYLQYETANVAATTSSPVIARGISADATSGSRRTGVTFNRLVTPPDGDVSILISYGVISNSRAKISVAGTQGPVHLWVVDIGPSVPETGENRDGTADGGSGGTAPASRKNYSMDYPHTAVRSFDGSNAWYNYNGTKGYQGKSPAGYGNLRSSWHFDTTKLINDVGSGTIYEIWAYFYFEHWYYAGGGTALIGVHNDVSVQATFAESTTVQASLGGWPRGAGRWVKLPSGLYAGFKSGTYRGVTLLGDGSYGTYGIANAAKLRVKYTKTG